MQDQIEQDYRPDESFFTVEDYIWHSSTTVGEYYKAQYEQEKEKLRQEKSDELIVFSPDILVSMLLPVKGNSATLTDSVMSFIYDGYEVGIQEVFVTKPSGVKLERTSLSEKWKNELLPVTDRIFWWPAMNQINFHNKTNFNVQEIQVLYVPGISNTMLVPDSIVGTVVTQTVMKLKQIAQGIIIKTGEDLNPNKLPQTEIDAAQLK